jgi:hypothetical protein
MWKSFIYILLLWGINTSLLKGQALDIPRPSPKASVSQMIGVANVRIDYCRPSVRGRPVFGELVPFGKVWRAGANEATTIHFDQPVMLGGREAGPGTYGLFMIPDADRWVIILNTEWDQWGAYHYDSSKDALRLEVSPLKNTLTELLTYTFTEVTKSSAVLNLLWEDVRIPIPLQTSVQEQTLAGIDRAVEASRQNWYIYSAAAHYHYHELKENDKAKAYLDIAIALQAPNPAPWMLKSQILASEGRYKEAIQLAKEAIEVCKAHDFDFEIEENERQIRKWEKL